MRLRRRPRTPWAPAAERFAVPNLPGDWLVVGDALIMQPVGLIARGVARGGYSPNVILHPLYMPLDDVDTGWKLGHDLHISDMMLDPFTTVDGGEPYMRRLAAAISDQVLPFLDRHGTPEGYLDWCRSINARVGGLGNERLRHQQAATEIILRRYEDAARDLALVRRICDSETPPRKWVRDLSEQAGALGQRLVSDPEDTRQLLLNGVAEQRRRRRLPPADC